MPVIEIISYLANRLRATRWVATLALVVCLRLIDYGRGYESTTPSHLDL
jgi:hypothetical protein